MENKAGYGFLRESQFPTMWCAGCGHGIVVHAVTKAMQKLKFKQDDVLAISGIGCSSRAPAYIDCNSIQTTHGRAIAYATGMKMQRPDMPVIMFLGDGDCAAIGGNHFIHAARRNIDLTVVIMNNQIYGMTGGQTSPTTPAGDFSSTSPFGSVEQPLDICALAMAAGGTFVARTTAYHASQLASLIEQGIRHKGFSVIECATPCPTGYGRKNNMRNVVKMYEMLRDNSVNAEKAKTLSEEELKDKIVTGILKNEEKAEFIESYMSMVERISGTNAGEDNGLEIKAHNYSKELKRYEMRLSGSGGQGLILGAIIFSEGAIMEGLNAVQGQSYGTEARGGASRGEVILSVGDIDFPEVLNPDVLLAMTQQACDKFASTVKNDGLIVLDSTFVKEVPDTKTKVYSLPITQLTIDNFGTLIMANVLALGVIGKLTGLVSLESLEKAVAARVPAKVKEKNIKALRIGYEQGEKLAKGEII
jgi:2-oxoglutarate ferredoxin oxidoreductase subunit beta